MAPAQSRQKVEGIASPRESSREAIWKELAHVIEHAAHQLPAQGPIPVFIHHNTLHAFEDLPFTEAVEQASRLYGCEPYWTEERYRSELLRGRIRLADLEAVIFEDLGERANEKVVDRCSRLDLRLAMLQHPLRLGTPEELSWYVMETDALREIREEAPDAHRNRLIAETRRWVMRDLRPGASPSRKGAEGEDGPAWRTKMTDLIERFGSSTIEEWSEETWEAFTLQALWQVCLDGVGDLPATPDDSTPLIRHRDWLRWAGAPDADVLVHSVLIPFCAAFLDQGLSSWPLPNREEGFYASFCKLYAQPLGPPVSWRRGLAEELRRHMEERVGPLESIRQSLEDLGVEPAEWDEYLSATLLALRGWAGMLWFLENRPDRAVHPVPPGSLKEYVAVRFILDRWAVRWVAREHHGYGGPLAGLRDQLRATNPSRSVPSIASRAFQVFQLAPILGWTPEQLSRLSRREWHNLVGEIEAFHGVERRRLFHLAYERRFYTQVLDAITCHNRRERSRPSLPRCQALFCIDEREESLRRHVEEVASDVQTFGIAGFFFVPMYYRGWSDAHFVPLCPIVLKPKNWVVEQLQGDEQTQTRLQRKRQVWGRVTHQIHVGSRTFALGAIVSGLLGVSAVVPLIFQTLFPRWAGSIRGLLGRWFLRPPATRLQLERRAPSAGPHEGHIGFDVDEMTEMAERVLRDTGLTAGWARIVVILGHGSTSANNPHKSAYDCGACGGAEGGPNARALAQILNDPRVRERLAGRGLPIPPTTWFVGGMHNTASDTITWFDEEHLPSPIATEFEEIRQLFEQALARNAQERCRRFETASLTITPEEARKHVESRAEDLAQVRTELGHATNAILIVGRRERTRGLFLDRRAFLNSYDPTQDDAEGTILSRILQAALPVCAGINLEYYFSCVDNVGYGCGSKLPHNITSLLGVMDGAASDLRTGLPWQMIEIHEPVRLLCLVETEPAKLLRIIDRQPVLARLVRHGWVQLATLDPRSPALSIYRNGEFRPYIPTKDQLPTAPSSAAWYRGWRDHLEFATIAADLSGG